MNRKKVILVVKGYLLKDKKNTILTSLFLCFITIFLLIGNQLFQNLQLANKMNAEALEGKQHVTYYGVLESEFKKIKKCSFVAEAGQSFYLGHADDGTTFAYIDEVFRDLSATVADKNVKQVVSGHWAEKENEVVFTENYMKEYNLKLGDQVNVDLTAEDSDTGDMLFQVSGLNLTIVGVIENVTGFADRRMGYVSEELASSIIDENNGVVNVVARFTQEKNISENVDKLNLYLGYDEESLDSVVVRENAMLIEAVDDNGNLKNQNRAMNFIIWLVCVMVVYNIFYNRFFTKKRDFINLRKIGFQGKDLLKITGMEFFVLIFIGFVTGILIGFLVNKIVYSEIMKSIINNYDASNFVSSNLSLYSIGSTILMLLLVLIPSIVTAVLQLRTIAPVDVMRNKRKNTRKMVLALMIVSLSAILISLLGIQDNKSDSGIIYVKTYVPGDLQVTIGNISSGILEDTIPSISDKALQEVRENPNIKQIQTYAVNYDMGIFLCEEKSKLNKEAVGYYEMMLEMEQKIDGKKQCLYNMIPVATDNMKALVPSYDENKKEHVAIMEEGVAQALNLKVGDTFTLYSEQLIATGSKKGVTNVTVKLVDTKADMVLSENHVGPNLLIVDEETAKLFSGKLSRQVINIWVESGKEEVVMSSLNRISEFDGCFLHSAKQQMQEYIDSDRNQIVIHYFFIILLALISILTYFNTVFTNILSRMNEFLIMHKIGITNREMYQMVIKEGIRNGVVALAVIGIVQVVLCMNRNIGFNKVFLVTDMGVIISCILFPVIVLCYIFKKVCWGIKK